MRTLEDSAEPIVYKVENAALRGTIVEHAGAANHEVAFRVDIRSLSGMQKEGVVSRIAPAGPTWRLACDEGPYLNGTDLAPFPLGYFAAGLQFSFLTELIRHAGVAGIRIGSLTAIQDTKYTMSGSAIRGDMTGGALPVAVQVSMEADAAPDRLASLVALAELTSPATALMRDSLANTFALTLNGRAVGLGAMSPSSRSDAVDPAAAFETIRPIWAVGVPRQIITKTAEAERVHGIDGGVASSLQAEQKRTLHIRATARLLDEGLIETVLTLFKPLGSTFRFLCDPRAEAQEDGRTPSGLAYLAAGIGFCFMTQLGRYAHIVKQQVRSTRVVQFNRFRWTGPGGTGSAGSDPVDTHVFMSADEPDEAVRKAVVMGEQTCFLHAAMRGHFPAVIRR